MMKKPFLITFFIFIGLSSYSCSNIPVSFDQPSASFQSPQEVDRKYVESFDPVYKPGMAYTYSITSSAKLGQSPEIASTEILEVSGEILKVRLASTKSGTQVKTGKISEFDSGLPETGIISEGTEDITVPSGDYKGAVKLSCFVSTGEEGSPKTKTTLWLVKDIGVVKRTDILPDATLITTELKEFKS